jgi:hypothetical protein
MCFSFSCASYLLLSGKQKGGSMNFEAASIWFIQRFLESESARNFALRLNGLVEMSEDEAKKMRANRYRMTRYDFRFTPVADSDSDNLLVEPNTKEAEWARGFVFLDRQGNFRFASVPLPAIDPKELYLETE